MLSFGNSDAFAEAMMKFDDAEMAGPVAFRSIAQWRVQAVHVEATVAIVTEQQLILKSGRGGQVGIDEKLVSISVGMCATIRTATTKMERTTNITITTTNKQKLQ